jgi:hypothetical protein
MTVRAAVMNGNSAECEGLHMTQETRWTGQANVDSPEFAAALPHMSRKQLTFYANALKIIHPDAHKHVLNEIDRRVVLAYIEEGLGK